MLKVADVQFVTVIVSAHTSLSFVDELSTFGRWLDGGTPIRNKEFTYVHSELALALVFIQAVPAVWYESIVLFHPNNAKLLLKMFLHTQLCDILLAVVCQAVLST